VLLPPDASSLVLQAVDRLQSHCSVCACACA
jgi:hypothetical protein